MISRKSILLKLLAIAMVPLFLSGCINDLFDDNEITYEGAELEFFPLSETLTLESDESTTLGVNIQLIAEQQDEDVDVSFTVSEDSDAEEGDDYELPEGTSFTIESGSSTVEVPVEATGENVPTGKSVQLILELEDSGDITAAPNLSTFTLTIQGG